MGISHANWHKRRKSGGKTRVVRKKRRHEMGRPKTHCKLGGYRIRLIRARGGNIKRRALRLEGGVFSWGSESISRCAQILDVVYNASSNELVRTKTLVKNAIVIIDASPFRTWYESHYALPLGRAKERKGESKLRKKAEGLGLLAKKYRVRRLKAGVELALEEQFSRGKILACLNTKPGQVGRADGYILEGKELEFYLRRVKIKRTR